MSSSSELQFFLVLAVVLLTLHVATLYMLGGWSRVRRGSRGITLLVIVLTLEAVVIGSGLFTPYRPWAALIVALILLVVYRLRQPGRSDEERAALEAVAKRTAFRVLVTVGGLVVGVAAVVTSLEQSG